VDKARRKDLIAGAAVFTLSTAIASVLLFRARDTVGLVFGVLFVVVGVLGGFSIVRLDGGKLARMRDRLLSKPSDAVWLHWSTIPNKLRKGECSVMVFWCDGTYARLALPKVEARELFELIRGRAPNAKVTEELSLPDLLALEGKWRQDPATFG
jgi:hypothetical protein